jgi:hypothetical protein
MNEKNCKNCFHSKFERKDSFGVIVQSGCQFNYGKCVKNGYSEFYPDSGIDPYKAREEIEKCFICWEIFKENFSETNQELIKQVEKLATEALKEDTQ